MSTTMSKNVHRSAEFSLPSLQEIRERAAAIRASWSEEEKSRRQRQADLVQSRLLRECECEAA